MRPLNKLKAAFVRGASGDGRWSDGGGLYLQSRNGGLSWVFSYTRHGRTRSMGLGAAQVVSLALARELAAEQRTLLARGLDPLDERQRKAQEARAERAKRVSFKQCAEDYLAANEGRWRNRKHRLEWESAVTRFAYPLLGALPVHLIDTALVLQVLQPLIAAGKLITASRLRGRIESVLDYATALQRRTGDNPASKDILVHLLPLKTEKTDVAHQPALPFALVPQFMRALRTMPGYPARLLEMIVLTGMRLNALRPAHCREFDLDNAVWVIPAGRMKQLARDHRIPLVGRALELARELTTGRKPEAPVFGEGKPCADDRIGKGVLPKLCEAIGYDGEVTTHGFRSCLRDWVAERTSFAYEVIEQALGHRIKSAVERAYRRGDLFDKRQQLMIAWDHYCSGEPAEVIALRA
jgi:integrase